MDTVNNIPGDKHQRIVSAGLEVFGKHGYKKATMDEIVSLAGISKGLIFHYFGNKKKFYLYLYDFTYGLIYNRVMGNLNTGERDLFKLIRRSETIKIGILKEHLYMLDFMISVKEETDPVLAAELEKIKKQYKPWNEDFLKNVDLSKIKDGIEPDYVINMITWISKGLVEARKKDSGFEEICEELDIYLDILKQCLYKEECL